MAQLIFIVIIALSLCTFVAVLRRAPHVASTHGAAEMALAVATVAGGVFTQTSAGTGSAGIRLTVASIALTCGFLVLVERHRTGRLSAGGSPAAAVLAFLLWLWLFAADLSKNHISSVLLGSRILPGAIWALIVAITLTGTLPIEVFAVAGAATLAVVGMTLPAQSTPWHPCSQYKCPALGKLLAGPFASENYLAMQAVFIGVLAVLALRGGLRTLATAMAFMIVYATGSRTSLFILLACAALVAGSRAARGILRRRTPPSSWPAAVVAAAAVTAVGLFLLYSAGPGSFSRRGAIWMQGLAAMHGHALTGAGADRWEALRTAGLVPDHFTHSLYLLVFFSGGAIGIALFLAWASAVLRASARNSTTPIAHMALGIAFLGIGLTEVVWNPLSFDSLSWAAIALTAGGSFASDTSTGSDDPATHSHASIEEVSVGPA